MRPTSWALATVVLGCGPSGRQTCDTFVSDVTACYDGYCSGDGADTAFCACWDQGMDLDGSSCECGAITIQLTCYEFSLADYREGDLDCVGTVAALPDTCDG